MRTCEACCYRTCRSVRGPMLRILPLLAALLVAEASYSQTAKFGWSFPPAEPLRVHIVRGSAYYDRDYRIEEVLAHAGVNLFTESTQADRGISEYGDTSSSETGWLWQYADPSGQTSENPVSPSSVDILTMVLTKDDTD